MLAVEGLQLADSCLAHAVSLHLLIKYLLISKLQAFVWVPCDLTNALAPCVVLSPFSASLGRCALSWRTEEGRSGSVPGLLWPLRAEDLARKLG